MKKRFTSIVSIVLSCMLLLSSCSSGSGNIFSDLISSLQSGIMELFETKEAFVARKSEGLLSEDNKGTLPESFIAMCEKLPEIDNRAGYKHLEKDEQITYKRIYEAAMGMETFVSLCDLDLTGDALNKTINTLLNDSPEIFFITNSCVWYYYHDGSAALLTLNYYDGKTADTFDEEYKGLVAEASRKAIAIQAGELAEVAERLANEGKNLASEEAKVRYVHDLIISKTKYNHKYSEKIEELPYEEHPSTAYGCLVKNDAVCSGYTEGTALLLSLLSIENTVCKGKYEDVYHAWNIVNIGGEYYHLDTTYNDVFEGEEDWSSYEYYLLNDSEIAESREVFSLENTDDGVIPFPKPECNGKDIKIFDDISVLHSASAGVNTNEIAKAMVFAAKNDIDYVVIIADKELSRRKLEKIAESVYASSAMSLASGMYGRNISFGNLYYTFDSGEIYMSITY